MSEDILRPIIGIENRTAQEVFDIMCDRFRASQSLRSQAGVSEAVVPFKHGPGCVSHQDYPCDCWPLYARPAPIETTADKALIHEMREALRMISGEIPCPDNLMGNSDIANFSLSKAKSQQEGETE